MRAAIKQTILGLPTTGVMGKNPALTVGGILGICGVVTSVAAQYFGWTLPPEVQIYADEWGAPLAGAALAGYGLLQAWITRQRVVSPATARELVNQVAVNPSVARDLA